MPVYSKPLGDVVKSARKRMDLTQNEVADSIDVDTRTIINIENYKGNPKLEVLYPLIRSLKIDAREIFYPEMQRESPALCQLRLLVEDCSEDSKQYRQRFSQRTHRFITLIETVFNSFHLAKMCALGQFVSKC